MKSPCLSKSSRCLFDLTWARRHNALLMVWSEEKGEERATAFLGNDLKYHWIRCSVKYYRYPLAESNLNHYSSKFLILSVRLSLCFIFMRILAGDEGVFQWWEYFLKTRYYCLISPHHDDLSLSLPVSMLLSPQHDALLPCGAVIKTRSVTTGVQRLLGMGLHRCWTPTFNLQWDLFGSIKDQIQILGPHL